MIEDGCHTIADAIDDAHHGAPIHVVERESLVEPPPQALQDLSEVAGGRAFERHATREGAVEMGMSIDEARHDDAASGVEEADARMGSPYLSGWTDASNQSIANGDTTVFEEGLAVIMRDDGSAADQQVCRLLHGAMDSSQGRRLSVVIQITLPQNTLQDNQLTHPRGARDCSPQWNALTQEKSQL